MRINAKETVVFDGESSDGTTSAARSTVGSGVVGKAGGIEITTGSLRVTNGANLDASTLGKGNAGSVTITATETVVFDGESSDGLPSAASSLVGPEALGKAGGIEITTGSLRVANGAQLDASTFGEGDAGRMKITARETVELDGERRSDGFPSGAFTQVEPLAEGKAGGIELDTGSLRVTNGAQLSASTLGQGDAGSVKITARETVELDGESSDGFTTAASSAIGPLAEGNAGGIEINTRSLQVTNGAILSASSLGAGAAGNLEVEADSILLSNQASLIADTTAGQGNIFLDSQDLVLRRGSDITTNATGTATGGNITIDTDILAALEDSDISANAQTAFGGRVIIDAQGVFGTEFREEDTLESDITATSELGSEFSGIVEINTPDVDPSSGLVNLPEVPVDTEVAQGCTTGSSLARSEFIITGRGGLPPNPGDALNTDAVQVDLITLEREHSSIRASGVEEAGEAGGKITSKIVEATAWVKDANANVVLIADASTLTPHSSWQKTTDCRAFNQQPGR